MLATDAAKETKHPAKHDMDASETQHDVHHTCYQKLVTSQLNAYKLLFILYILIHKKT